MSCARCRLEARARARRGSGKPWLILLVLVIAVAVASQAKPHAAPGHQAQTQAAIAGAAVTEAAPGGNTVTTQPGNPNEQLADKMAAAAGWPPGQRRCMDLQLTWESGGTWSTSATGPPTSQGKAYGIAQALPRGKMAAYGADWATSAVTQIRFYLGYMRDRYGSPCASWKFEQANSYY